ncbi:inverse autotransporter beta domain-containing protein [Edwardsiella anguillarum]|nr:inverse autotransporter beta domain-containing protein [Edwardsiella anguillarum]
MSGRPTGSICASTAGFRHSLSWGALIYEHYFGDSVALFGKEHLQRNPYAITIGGNYTPFSLLTLEVKQRLGKQGNQDTQLGLQINYRIGAEVLPQLDPAELIAARTIVKTRYDLVERNHNIVLQYQEQQMLKIKSTEYLEGIPVIAVKYIPRWSASMAYAIYSGCAPRR